MAALRIGGVPWRAAASAVIAVAVALAAFPGALIASRDSDASRAMLPMAAPAGQPATSIWGWVVVRDDDLSHTPNEVDQGNSTGGTNTVEYIGLGNYLLRMPGLGVDGGSVLVSTLGSKPKICVPEDWDPLPGEQRILVRCFSRVGHPANSTFIVNYVKAFHGGGNEIPHRFAYIFEALPTGGAEYDPDRQYDSRGGVIQGDRVGYLHREAIPDLGSNRGHVQVTASAITEGGGASVSPAVCSVQAWYDQQTAPPSDLIVATRCRSHTGALLTDRMFEVLFTQGDDIQGLGGRVGAYLLADRPTASSYVPRSRYTFLQYGGTARITRQGVGRYTVRLPYMQVGGSVQVTPYGKAARHCVVGSILTDSLPQRVGVRCFDFAGNAKDAMFTLAYAW